MGSKIAVLAALFFPASTSGALLLQVCVATSLADVALRVAASRGYALSCGKHGTDLLLAAVCLAALGACGRSDEAATDGTSSGGGARYCQGIKLVLPFVLLVSLGGNLMRLTRAPPGGGAQEDDGDGERGYIQRDGE
mmetsp:Transcript_18370/g.50393  ORF Transcript_18370/g.50393 Transcript_18370/m.50393 type:complete len:137 (-) Transcript_18370:238-648(-)